MPRTAVASSSATVRKNTAKTYRRKAPVRSAVRPRAVTGTREPKRTQGMRYPGAGGKIGGVLGSAFGPMGSMIGSGLGNLAHSALYALTGFGDYKVQSNTLLETNGPPKIENKGKEFVVRHREYIKDIYSGTGLANTASPFALESFSINPGNINTFPWLSALADKFEQYRIEGMVFEFKSLYSDAVVTQNGSIGSIILATEYNAASPPFQNKQAMENYEFAQSAKPSMSIIHPIECARSQSVLSELYVRTAAVPTGEDIKTYDFGDFQIASQGIPLGSANLLGVNLGELWVSYQISFLKPKVHSVANVDNDSGFAAFSTIAGIAPYGTPVPFTDVKRLKSSNLPITLIGNNQFRVEFGSVPRNYQLNFVWYSPTDVLAGPAVWQSPIIAFTNMASINSGVGGEYRNIRLPFGSSTPCPGTGCELNVFFRAPAATASISFGTFNISAGSFDTVNPVRFDGYINAVPLVLE